MSASGGLDLQVLPIYSRYTERQLVLISPQMNVQPRLLCRIPGKREILYPAYSGS
jgi:hypothetical protein